MNAREWWYDLMDEIDQEAYRQEALAGAAFAATIEPRIVERSGFGPPPMLPTNLSVRTAR